MQEAVSDSSTLIHLAGIGRLGLLKEFYEKILIAPAVGREVVGDGAEMQIMCNYPCMLIGLPIAILYFLARKITAEGAEERRAFNHLFSLCVSLRALRLYSVFGYSIPHVPGSSCIVKSPDSGLGTSGSYNNV